MRSKNCFHKEMAWTFSEVTSHDSDRLPGGSFLYDYRGIRGSDKVPSIQHPWQAVFQRSRPYWQVYNSSPVNSMSPTFHYHVLRSFPGPSYINKTDQLVLKQMACSSVFQNIPSL
jgi:hypothetical protein